MTKGKIKKFKNIIIASIATLSVANVVLLSSLGIINHQKQHDNIETPDTIVDVDEQLEVQTPTSNTNTNINDNTSGTQTPTSTNTQEQTKQYRSLDELRQVKLPTQTKTFKGVEYEVVAEEDLLNIAREFKYAIKDYFKAHGAGDWTNAELEQFWPEDIEYMVTAIAFVESSYRTNVINNLGCGGLTGIQKEDMLKTLDGWANNTNIWGADVPYINCNPDEVDIFNPVTCIEYTYYNIGFNLANRLKKDKAFVDGNGQKQSVWKNIDYSAETQNDMIIASHFWGVNNVVDGALNTSGVGRDLAFYQNSDYVNDVNNKFEQILNIKNGYGLS